MVEKHCRVSSCAFGTFRMEKLELHFALAPMMDAHTLVRRIGKSNHLYWQTVDTCTTGRLGWGKRRIALFLLGCRLYWGNRFTVTSQQKFCVASRWRRVGGFLLWVALLSQLSNRQTPTVVENLALYHHPYRIIYLIVKLLLNGLGFIAFVCYLHQIISSMT